MSSGALYLIYQGLPSMVAQSLQKTVFRTHAH